MVLIINRRDSMALSHKNSTLYFMFLQMFGTKLAPCHTNLL